MRVVTAQDLGALVREERRRRGLSQEELAKLVGVTRQWIIGFEQGRTRDFGAALRTLRVLGLAIEVVEEGRRGPSGGSVDLDLLLSRFDR